MKKKEIIKRVNSVLLCLIAHPDNEPGSEFSDRIDDLTEIREALSSEIKVKKCNHPRIEEIQGGQIERCLSCGKRWG